jgi:hypothetical protein
VSLNSLFCAFDNINLADKVCIDYNVSYLLDTLYMLLLVPFMYMLQTSSALLNSIFCAFDNINLADKVCTIILFLTY